MLKKQAWAIVTKNPLVKFDKGLQQGGGGADLIGEAAHLPLTSLLTSLTSLTITSHITHLVTKDRIVVCRLKKSKEL